MLRFILTLSLVASTLWFISTPGYDSFIAILTAIIALVTTEIKKPNNIATPKPSSSISEKSDEKNTFLSKAEVKTNEVFNLVEKLIYALNAHDIHSNEIPRFMPEEFGITLADLSSKENLLKKVTPQVIDWICVTFGIRREWFETDSDVIYETENFYKNEAALLRLMKKLKKLIITI